MKIECLFKDRGSLSFEADKIRSTYEGEISFINRSGFKIKVSYKKSISDDFVLYVKEQLLSKETLVDGLKEFGITEDFWVAYIGF
jgi:hypothetical protein|nr:MAG TPA: hypothetical protein [Caudoviricetes sp.]